MPSPLRSARLACAAFALAAPVAPGLAEEPRPSWQAPPQPEAGLVAGGAEIAPGLVLRYVPPVEPDREDGLGAAIFSFDNGVSVMTRGRLDAEEGEIGGALHLLLAF